MLDHVVIGVRDLDVSVDFYERALAPLDFAVIMRRPGVVGIGARGMPGFWLRDGGGREATHVAFRAPDRAAVDAFHAAALAAGASDNGGPGLREIYHPNYYGAFVLDPDGHNVEAVCHLPATG